MLRNHTMKRPGELDDTDYRAWRSYADWLEATKKALVNAGLNKLERIKQQSKQIAELKDDRKKDCCAFFRWWWNEKGNNTEQGYDKWEKLNKH